MEAPRRPSQPASQRVCGTASPHAVLEHQGFGAGGRDLAVLDLQASNHDPAVGGVPPTRVGAVVGKLRANGRGGGELDGGPLAIHQAPCVGLWRVEGAVGGVAPGQHQAVGVAEEAVAHEPDGKVRNARLRGLRGPPGLGHDDGAGIVLGLEGAVCEAQQRLAVLAAYPARKDGDHAHAVGERDDAHDHRALVFVRRHQSARRSQLHCPGAHEDVLHLEALLDGLNLLGVLDTGQVGHLVPGHGVSVGVDSVPTLQEQRSDRFSESEGEPQHGGSIRRNRCGEAPAVSNS